jgi:hyaluronan synthase
MDALTSVPSPLQQSPAISPFSPVPFGRARSIDLRDVGIKLAIVAVAAGLLWLGFSSIAGSKLELLAPARGPWGWLIWPGVAMSVLIGAAYVYRTVLWWRYRPIDGTLVADADLPTVTVVIPAYNEGQMVTKSILSAIGANYPADKLRVICVDDGSKDDTFEHMRVARATDRRRIQLVRLSQNRGKRHALYAGFKRAKSDVVVTLDSDSIMPPQSLRHLVAPFALNPNHGATAGCVAVYNRYQNTLTRMLGVRYLLGFEFTRAYQSQLKTVYCCPGAAAAYRRSVIEPHLDAWLDQTFLGNKCTNGDDHALTNVVLEAGCDVLYQGNAEVHTIVPHTYKRLAKMYTRWARSNIRESLRYMRFATRRARERGEWLAWLDATIHFIQIPARIYLFLTTGLLLFAAAHVLLRSLAMATVFSLLYAVYFLRSEKSTETIYGVLYAWFAMLTLQWIYPVALFTVHKNRWMTRG